MAQAQDFIPLRSLAGFPQKIPHFAFVRLFFLPHQFRPVLLLRLSRVKAIPFAQKIRLLAAKPLFLRKEFGLPGAQHVQLLLQLGGALRFFLRLALRCFHLADFCRQSALHFAHVFDIHRAHIRHRARQLLASSFNVRGYGALNLRVDARHLLGRIDLAQIRIRQIFFRELKAILPTGKPGIKPLQRSPVQFRQRGIVYGIQPIRLEQCLCIIPE